MQQSIYMHGKKACFTFQVYFLAQPLYMHVRNGRHMTQPGMLVIVLSFQPPLTQCYSVSQHIWRLPLPLHGVCVST